MSLAPRPRFSVRADLRDFVSGRRAIELLHLEAAEPVLERRSVSRSHPLFSRYAATLTAASTGATACECSTRLHSGFGDSDTTNFPQARSGAAIQRDGVTFPANGGSLQTERLAVQTCRRSGAGNILFPGARSRRLRSTPATRLLSTSNGLTARRHRWRV